MDCVTPDVEMIVSHLKASVPALNGQVAGYASMPSPDMVTQRFKTRPYALVFPTGFRALDRDPVDTVAMAFRKKVSLLFDIAIAFDQGLQGQAKQSVLAESLPHEVADAVCNLRAGTWLFDWDSLTPAANTNTEALVALSIAATSWVECGDPNPAPEGAPLTRIHAKGSLS